MHLCYNLLEKPQNKTVATEDVYYSVERNTTLKFQLFSLARVTCVLSVQLKKHEMKQLQSRHKQIQKFLLTAS